MSDMQNNPGECDCCGFATAKIEHFQGLDTTIGGGGRTIKSDFWYCDLCAGTITSSASRYPGRYANADILRALCFIGNEIIAAIERMKP